MQAQEDTEEHGGSPPDGDGVDELVPHGTSTKQPIEGKGKKPLSKRQKLEITENELLKKAIDCLDKTAGEPASTPDGFEFFGRYIATELRAIVNPHAQRWAKLQMQNILFTAASDTSPHCYSSLTPPYRPASSVSSHSSSPPPPFMDYSFHSKFN